MSTVIHRDAVVGPDGHIDIAMPELAPGQRVSITIEPEPAASANATPAAGAKVYTPEGAIPMIDIIRQAPGQQLFKTADEVDEYIRRERESWDR